MAGYTAVLREMGHGISAFSQMARQGTLGKTAGNTGR